MNKLSLRVGFFHHWNHLYYQGFNYLDPRFPLPLWNNLKQDQYLLRLLKGFYSHPASGGRGAGSQKKIGRPGIFSRSPLSFSGGATGRLPFQIHKSREGIDLYISKDRPLFSPFPLVPALLHGAGALSRPSSSFPSLLPPVAPNSGAPLGAPSHPASGVRGGIVEKIGRKTHRILFNILKSRINIFYLFTFPLHDAELLVSYLLRDHKNKSRLTAFKKLWKSGIIKGIKIKIQGRYKKSTRTQNEVYQFGQIPNTPTTNLNINLFYTRQLLLQSLGSSSLHLYIVYSLPTD